MMGGEKGQPMTPEQAMAYIEEHPGQLCCYGGNTKWPDGTTTNSFWQYGSGGTCIIAAKTALEAIERHAESGKDNE